MTGRVRVDQATGATKVYLARVLHVPWDHIQPYLEDEDLRPATYPGIVF
ncbi:hypothetical protein CNECB9_2280006 [Cupriavidus necator]|uniref:Uncharacterized protein n=1 Tax=Cupriavidus necator TaxID=106590 RepID=A0A1K0IDH1_CUPNE|nr:hypothetical protein CNECB9_2280006 [Cupriavidus necator]